MKKLIFKSLESAKNAEANIKTEILHANFRMKNIKSEGEGEKEVIKISGYASTKDRDRYGDIVEPSAFKKTMKTYMTNPMLLLQHNMDKQIGVVTSYEIDDNGLKIDAEVKYTAGDPELFEKITNGDLKGFSIGFRIKELELIEDTVDGEDVWTFIIRELELLEISVVTIPANPYTLMKSLADIIGKIKSEDGDVDPWKGEEEEGENNNIEIKNIESEKDTEEESEKEDGEEIEEETEEETEEEDEKIEEEKEDNEKEEGEKNQEKKEFEKKEEINKIKNEESDKTEKSGETPETQKEGLADKSKEEGEKNFTVKTLKKLLEPEMEKINKSFEKQIKESEKENLKMLESMLGIIEEQGKSIEKLTSALNTVTSGKGFIYTEEEKTSNTKEDKFLKVFEKMKKQF